MLAIREEIASIYQEFCGSSEFVNLASQENKGVFSFLLVFLGNMINFERFQQRNSK